MAHIRRLIPALRPVEVSNASSAHSLARPILPAEIAQELVDWGGQIAVTQVLRGLNRHLPGIAWIHDGWRLRQFLADARACHLRDALRQVPATLMLSAAGEALLDGGPRSVEISARYEAMMLLIAAVAWATRQANDLRIVPPTLPRRAVVGALRGIRMLSTALSAIAHNAPSAAPDICGNGYCLEAMPGSFREAVTGNQTAPITPMEVLPLDRTPMDSAIAPATGWMPTGGFGLFPSAYAKSSGGRGAPPRPAKPKAPMRPAKRRIRTGVKITRNRKRDPAATDALNASPASKHDGFLIRGAARNSGAMAGHAQAANGEGARESMMGPLSHSSSVVFKSADTEDRRRAQARDVPTMAPATRAVSRKRPSASSAPPVTAATSPAAVARLVCLRFHDVRQTCADLRALGGQSAVIRYCIHPGAEERFTNAFIFPGAELPGGGARTIAHPIKEVIPEALRNLDIQMVRRPGPSALSRPVLPHRIGHNLIYAVATLTLLEGPMGEAHVDDPMSLLRNTFRLLELTDTGGTQHLFIAYLVARGEPDRQGVAAGFLDVEVDEVGAVSVRDVIREQIISAPDLKGLIVGLQDLSGLTFDPGPKKRHTEETDGQGPITAEPATNLWVAEEERRSWEAPHERLPYDRSLGFINPVVVARSAHHPALALYPNSFTIIGDCLVYADETRNTGVLRFGCPVTRLSGSAILHCPAPCDGAFASRFGLQAGYAYNLDALADQLEAGGMVRVSHAVIEERAAGDVGTTTVQGDPESTPAGVTLCPACFTFNDGVLEYMDPHGQRGELRFDRAPGQRLPYVLGDIERSQDRAFALLNGFERLRRYTEDDIVLWLVGEGYERVGANQTMVDARN